MPALLLSSWNDLSWAVKTLMSPCSVEQLKSVNGVWKDSLSDLSYAKNKHFCSGSAL